MYDVLLGSSGAFIVSALYGLVILTSNLPSQLLVTQASYPFVILVIVLFIVFKEKVVPYSITSVGH